MRALPRRSPATARLAGFGICGGLPHRQVVQRFFDAASSETPLSTAYLPNSRFSRRPLAVKGAVDRGGTEAATLGHMGARDPSSSDLRCAECDRRAPTTAQGWKAEIGDDVRDDDPPEVVMFCPECWSREFGCRNE